MRATSRSPREHVHQHHPAPHTAQRAHTPPPPFPTPQRGSQPSEAPRMLLRTRRHADTRRPSIACVSAGGNGGRSCGARLASSRTRTSSRRIARLWLSVGRSLVGIRPQALLGLCRARSQSRRSMARCRRRGYRTFEEDGMGWDVRWVPVCRVRRVTYRRARRIVRSGMSDESVSSLL